ncbi:uncharacterized protein LOC100214894 [Hydra vulgaris]|uniref:uncharacterized protein LOC100214894 n=1 Tax=Hydra vulgaris TaxID=6087 RepID=UPI0002B44B0E|nr:uncharacterized protein LOC100214894 [Hydra vulgaris]
MSSDDNLIDFSSDELLIPTASQVSMSIPELQVNTPISLPFDTPKIEKSNKSFFAITREETANESVQNDGSSELFNTLSEMHISNSNLTAIDGISYNTDLVKQLDEQNDFEKVNEHFFPVNHLENSFSTSTPVHVTDTGSTLILDNNNFVSPSVSSTSQNIVMTASHSCAEPPSRFRIVKIAKTKPYDKGKWIINDYTDFQKQNINDCESSGSSIEKKNGDSYSSDEHKDITKTVASLTPRKTMSNELISNSVFSISRGGSCCSNFLEKNLVESVSIHNPGQSTHHVIPVVEALDTAMDQIQQIRDAMIHAVTDEMRTLQDSLANLQLEYNKLKEENLALKIKLAYTEERLRELEKG